MKLYEIDGYLTGIKLRTDDFAKGNSVFFVDGVWIRENGDVYTMTTPQAEYNGWEHYEEPKKKVMLSRYRVCNYGSKEIYIPTKYYTKEEVKNTYGKGFTYEKHGEEIEAPEGWYE